jgi:acetyl-CoA C-acetyltransferase
MMREAVIVGAARTPVGKARGALASVPAHKLGALVVNEAIRRAGVEAGDVEELLFGNLFANEYSNIARVIALESVLPERTPALTLDRQCASSLSAFAIASALIVSGQADILVAGGVESDSRRTYVMEKPTAAYQIAPPQWVTFRSAPVDADNISMIETAENVADKLGLTREECDRFTAESHRKAAAAWEAGYFDSQVVPVEVPGRKGEVTVFSKDESIREGTSVETLAKLRPIVREGGIVTAGNSSPMNDGAGAIVVMEKEKAKSLGLPILGKFIANAAVGLDPKVMGLGPVYAVRKLMEKTERALSDIDLIEMNEAFAAQSVGCIRELDMDEDKLNVNGGAIALGHPLAGTGAILLTKLVYELARRDKQSGIVTFCAAGGQGVAVLIERE